MYQVCEAMSQHDEGETLRRKCNDNERQVVQSMCCVNRMLAAGPSVCM